MAQAVVSIGETRHDNPTHVRRPGSGTSYTVAVPVRGAMGALHRGRTVDGDPAHAVVFQPDDDVDMRCGSGFFCYAVTIDTNALENVLEHRLGHAVARPPELAERLDLSTPTGRAWTGLVRLLVTSPVLRQPLLIDRVQETLMARLLLALNHADRDELDAPVHSWGPGPVRRMVDAIEATPRHPFTLAELSDTAGVSVRALQACCRRHLGITPADQLRVVRLVGAHRELVGADAGDTSAADVASAWGFASPARFVADYGVRYGVSPWQTLRGPAYA